MTILTIICALFIGVLGLSALISAGFFYLARRFPIYQLLCRAVRDASNRQLVAKVLE